MFSLVTLSHGSRHRAAARGVEALTRAAAQRARVSAYAASHLEFNSPDLTSVAAGLADAGAHDAVVIPLLFSQGYHQRVDVPGALRAASRATGVRLHRTPGLGLGDDMASCIAKRARAAVGDMAAAGTPADHVVLYSVGSSVAAANTAVSEFADRVGRLAGLPTSAAFATRGGVEDIAKRAARGERVVVVPLFVTDGLLLDRLKSAHFRVDPAVWGAVTVLPPLREALADIVAKRYTTVAEADGSHRSAVLVSQRGEDE